MLRGEDLIKHSGIIEYLKERIKLYEEPSQEENWSYNCAGAIKEELEHILNHFKELSKDGH